MVLYFINFHLIHSVFLSIFIHIFIKQFIFAVLIDKHKLNKIFY